MSTSKKAVVITRNGQNFTSVLRLVMCEMNASGQAIIPSRVTDSEAHISYSVDSGKLYKSASTVLNRLAYEINYDFMSFDEAIDLAAYIFEYRFFDLNPADLIAFLAPADIFNRIRTARVAGIDFLDLVEGSMMSAAA